MITHLAGWAAGVASAAGYVLYIWSIVTGRTRSAGQLSAWLMWSMEYTVLFAALLAAGQRDALWLPGAELAGTLVAAVLVFWRREPGIDWGQVFIYGGFTAGALTLWQVSGNPYAGVVIILAVDAVGITLIARQAWAQPGSELPEAWACWAAGGVLGCVAARGGDPMAFAFPTFLAVTCAGVLAVIFAGELRPAAGHAHGTLPPGSDVISAGPGDRAPLVRPAVVPAGAPRPALATVPPRRGGGRAVLSGMGVSVCAAAVVAVFAITPGGVAGVAAVLPAAPAAGMHPVRSGPAGWAAPQPRHRGVLLEKKRSADGPVLADSHGRVLYTLTQGTCTGWCRAVWAPLRGLPAAVPGFHLTGRFGTTRAGQSTYRGNPLWVHAGWGVPGARWRVLHMSPVGPLAVSR